MGRLPISGRASAYQYRKRPRLHEEATRRGGTGRAVGLCSGDKQAPARRLSRPCSPNAAVSGPRTSLPSPIQGANSKISGKSLSTANALDAYEFLKSWMRTSSNLLRAAGVSRSSRDLPDARPISGSRRPTDCPRCREYSRAPPPPAASMEPSVRPSLSGASRTPPAQRHELVFPDPVSINRQSGQTYALQAPHAAR